VHRAKWPTPDEVVGAIGGEDEAAVQVFTQAQAALGEVRRIKAMGKRPVKAAIDRAVLPKQFLPLEPAAHDFRAAAHIRDLVFEQVEEPQLTFAVEPVPEPRA
jgi:hypothetical protein